MTASDQVREEAYAEILRTARRWARSEEDARDLAQDALVIALARGFDDWSSPERRGWLRGVVRKRAAFVARGHGRRRRREELVGAPAGASGGAWTWRADFLDSLPRSLRVVAALASADLCAAEIRWLLGLSDTALRQRLSALRGAVRAEDEEPTLPASEPPVALGWRRTQLLSNLRRREGRVLATHDPDGHPIFLRFVPHGTGPGGNPR